MFKLLQPVDVTGPTRLLLTITPNNSCMQYVYTRDKASKHVTLNYKRFYYLILLVESKT